MRMPERSWSCGLQVDLERERDRRPRWDSPVHCCAEWPGGRARRIGFGIYDRGQVLIHHPEAGSILPEKQDARWRKLIFKSWKIAYRIDRDNKTVHVIRVWHAAQGEIEV